MAYDKVIDSVALDAGMTATADAIRNKTGSSTPIAWEPGIGFKSAVDGIQLGGGSGGISAVKCVDEDITIEESTDTAVTYTIDGVQLPTFKEGGNKWNSYKGNEVYVCFITQKEVTGEYTGTGYVTRSAMFIICGHTNYGKVITSAGATKGTSGSIATNGGGFSGVVMGETVSYANGVATTSIIINVKTNGNYVAEAGVYNVQFWLLSDFKWGF